MSVFKFKQACRISFFDIKVKKILMRVGQKKQAEILWLQGSR